METTTILKPMTMAELMPGLTGILSADAQRSLTAKKQPRPTMAQTTRTAEKIIKPMTIAEMKTELLVFKVQSPRRPVQGAASARKKPWNSSVKLQSKKISHTADGQMKHNAVRKVLNFQPKPRSTANPRATINTETPKFPKPEYKAKKSMYQQACNNVRISGICNIAETPLFNKPIRNRMTLAKKENLPNIPIQANTKKKQGSPKNISHKKLVTLKVPDTPLSNESWKSSSDASFLQKEKEIQDIEDKTKPFSEEQRTLENIAEVSPPVLAMSMSTPFKEYRNIKEYFNDSVIDNSALYNDNTIMCFEKPKQNDKREESVIVSLCDMLNKATVSSTEKLSTELHDLLEVEKQTEHNIKMIENSIQTLQNIKESQMKSLRYVKKLICDRRNGQMDSGSEHDKTLVEQTKDAATVVKTEIFSPEKATQPSKPCSVIKSCIKSPSYKIPKKNLCLRKKVFHKSMPNVSNGMHTPNKDMNDKALNMYMKMKEHMNFLNTPIVKHRPMEVPDTPAVTSHNLQMQLDKLYGGS